MTRRSSRGAFFEIGVICGVGRKDGFWSSWSRVFGLVGVIGCDGSWLVVGWFASFSEGPGVGSGEDKRRSFAVSDGRIVLGGGDGRADIVGDLRSS